jgi:hypothetical protein
MFYCKGKTLHCSYVVLRWHQFYIYSDWPVDLSEINLVLGSGIGVLGRCRRRPNAIVRVFGSQHYSARAGTATGSSVKQLRVPAAPGADELKSQSREEGMWRG